MHKFIKATSFPIYVLSRYGARYYFEDYSYFLMFVREKHYGHFGNNFAEKRWRYKVAPKRYFFSWEAPDNESKETVLAPVTYVAYKSCPDEYDEVIPIKTFEYEIPYRCGYPNPRKLRRTWYWKSEHNNYPGFRNGPVPYTGKCLNSNWYRHPCTRQERRLNYAYKGYTRGKRRNLPTDWDDYGRADIRIKQSWKKRKKRKQWM